MQIKQTETEITQQIRAMLHILKIKHFKHFSGVLSPKGVSDIIGALHPTGRALFIEVKVPGKVPRPDQEEFLTKMSNSGALAFFATSSREVVQKLAEAGFEPAKAIEVQLPK